MVDTRRGNGNGRPVTIESQKTRSEGEDNDTIHVQKPYPRKVCHVLITPKPSKPGSTASPSSTGGMEDISLTSPSSRGSLPRASIKTPKRKRAPSAPDRTLSSALRRLSTKPGTAKGSANNPIDLDEYSPRRKPIPLPGRKHHEPEPHKFQNRHRKLYTYGQDAARTVLAPKPANGVKFTGDENDDLYRMMSAKMTAVGWTPPAQSEAPPPPIPSSSYPNANFGVPFEVQYPMSAHYLAQRPAQHQSPYAQYHTHMGVSLSGDSEDALRKQARQYVQEYSRPGCMLSDDDKPTPAPSKRRKLLVYRDQCDHVAPLVAQSALLAALLSLYPRSTDPRGLREDIDMLVKVQSRCVADWVACGDCDEARGKRAAVASEDAELKKKKDADAEVRGLLSAGALIWGDAGGEGVAGVFAAATEIETAVQGDALDEVRRKGVCGWAMVR